MHRDGDGLAVEANGAIVGGDPALRAVLALAARVAPTRVTVLIGGESGTGKELLARLIHERGPAPDGPFVAVNCGTLPRELADSELFGHERGAFTGAGTRKAGWFEEAHGGTLMLDEIGELPLDLQPKLLRVLETGRVRRVGGSGEIPVKVRVIATTWRDLRNEAERGAFRTDLYHRLAGFELAMPPLRRRLPDIPLLVTRFLDELTREVGPRTIDRAAIEHLMRHDWPGNVRELRNVLRRAAILSSHQIGVSSLELRRGAARGGGPDDGGPMSRFETTPRLADGEGPPAPRLVEALAGQDPGAGDDGTGGPGGGDLLRLVAGQTFDEIERAVLTWALRRNGGSRRRAARSLAMPRSTLCDKVKRYGLS